MPNKFWLDGNIRSWSRKTESPKNETAPDVIPVSSLSGLFVIVGSATQVERLESVLVVCNDQNPSSIERELENRNPIFLVVLSVSPTTQQYTHMPHHKTMATEVERTGRRSALIVSV